MGTGTVVQDIELLSSVIDGKDAPMFVVPRLARSLKSLLTFRLSLQQLLRMVTSSNSASALPFPQALLTPLPPLSFSLPAASSLVSPLLLRSYGTVVGQYLHAMFPDRVGRVVIDGVCDINNWVDNPQHTVRPEASS